MAMLKDIFVGKDETTNATTIQSGTAQRHPANKQAASLLLRNLIGQMVKPPNTAIAVPGQQATSLMQGFAGNPAASSIASRLGGSPVGAGQSFTPGAGQAGLQTREQLGLPDRQTYFPLTPTLDEIKDIGVPPIHRAGKESQRLTRKVAEAEKGGHHKRAARLRARQ